MSPTYDKEEEAGRVALRLAQASVLPMVLRSAIELNVIDIISTATDGGACVSASEIAGKINAKNPDAPVLLDRMLSLLASHDVLASLLRSNGGGQVDKVYSAGAVCKFLTRNHEDGSAGSLAMLISSEVYAKSWYQLSSAILEGGVPFRRAYGMTTFEYAGTDPSFNKLFNEALADYTDLFMNKMLRVYKGFSGVRVLVDVGGGTGIALSKVTAMYPEIKGVNFDLPFVVAHAPSYPGVEHVGGDMLVSVPKGDTIFFKSVLHDWNDEHCSKILRNCYEALPSNGKLVAVEWVLPEMPENNVATQIVLEQDVLMSMHYPGAKERRLKEFEALSLGAGFAKFQAVCCVLNLWVMEFLKSA